MHTIIALALLTGAAFAADGERLAFTYNSLDRGSGSSIDGAGAALFIRQSGSCDIGYKICGDGCIKSTSSCCSSIDSTSCPLGYYCDGTGSDAGCCPTGKVCSGLSGSCTASSKRCGDICIPNDETCSSGSGSGSGSAVASTTSTRTSTRTSTALSSSATCDADETTCAVDYCMPIGATCCTDGEPGSYCKAGYVCAPNNKCQRAGSGSGSTTTSTSAFDDDITTSTTRTPTSTRTSTSSRTSTTANGVVTVTASPGGNSGGSLGGADSLLRDVPVGAVAMGVLGMLAL